MRFWWRWFYAIKPSVRRWVAVHLRYSADVIDPTSGPRCTGLRLRIENGKGALVGHDHGPLIWVMEEDEQQRGWIR